MCAYKSEHLSKIYHEIIEYHVQKTEFFLNLFLKNLDRFLKKLIRLFLKIPL